MNGERRPPRPLLYLLVGFGRFAVSRVGARIVCVLFYFKAFKKQKVAGLLIIFVLFFLLWCCTYAYVDIIYITTLCRIFCCFGGGWSVLCCLALVGCICNTHLPTCHSPLPTSRAWRAQLEEAEAKATEAEAQKDAALAATASGSQQAELLAAQAAARADELRRGLDEAEAAAAASSAIGELQERLAALEGKLKEAEERALSGAAGVEGAGARVEEEEAKARELRRALEESAAERAEVYCIWSSESDWTVGFAVLECMMRVLDICADGGRGEDRSCVRASVGLVGGWGRAGNSNEACGHAGRYLGRAVSALLRPNPRPALAYIYLLLFLEKKGALGLSTDRVRRPHSTPPVLLPSALPHPTHAAFLCSTAPAPRLRSLVSTRSQQNSARRQVQGLGGRQGGGRGKPPKGGGRRKRGVGETRPGAGNRAGCLWLLLSSH